MPPDDVIGAHAPLSPAAIVAAIDSRAERIATPCGSGSMIWRRWAASPKEAPVLILLHGGYGSWTHWLRNVESLSARYSVLACDLPGLGESADAPKPYSAESLAAIVADGISRVAPGERVALCGFSFGSVIGGHVAAQMGNAVASFLMLGAAGLGLPRKPLALTRVEPGMTPARIAEVQRGNLIALMFGDASRVDDLAVHLQNENTRRGRMDSRSIAFTDTLVHTLPKATARLGAIWGEQDATAINAIEQNFAVLRKLDPGVYCDTIANAGHWAQWEQSKIFEAKLTAFIEGKV
ncbi:MAG TPA: alpha/beta hydrolase [Stellaceae bacterium]|nr:alpha/beta hydrolase [Stellaceae bacterium]